MLEPFVFISILASFIEFPAIQDLIYTKICIQVLEEKSYNQTYLLIEPTSPGHIIDVRNLTLPSNGRIQELNVSTNRSATSLNPVQNIAYNHNSNATTITSLYDTCRRMNKSAVPAGLKHEINYLDSLFWLKYQILICALCALASPYWGGVSDKIGRLIPMNVPILASIICNLISLIFATLISVGFHASVHLNWLLVGAVLVGISGGQSVLISNSFSYLSDNTSNEERTKRVTILESAIFLGQSSGFFVSKYIMSLASGSGEWADIWLNRHFVAFGANVLLNIICITYSVCNLRHRKFHRFANNFEREQQEQAAASAAGSTNRNLTDPTINNGERLRELTSSTPDDLDGPIARADKSNWNIRDTMVTFRYYKQTYMAALKPRDSRPIILWLLFACFISALSLATLMSLLFVYVRMEPFEWPTSQYSAWNSLSSIVRGTALVGLTLCMKYYTNWSVPDPLVSALGFLAKSLGLLVIGLAQYSSHLYWSLACLSLSEYSMPPIRSLMSKLLPREELGKLYACIGSLQNVCFILGNIAFYVVLNSTTKGHSAYYRLTFISAAGLEFFAVIVMLIIFTSLKRHTSTVI